MSHGDGDHRAAGIVAGHLFCGVDEGQHVFLAVGHIGHFDDIRSHALHQQEGLQDLGLGGCGVEVMLGEDDVHAQVFQHGDQTGVIFHHGTLHVQDLGKAAFCHHLQDLRVVADGGFHFSAFLKAAEREDNGLFDNVPESHQELTQLFRVEHVFIMICPEFHQVADCIIAPLSKIQDLFFCLADHQGTDLGPSLSDLQVSDLDHFSHGILLFLA